MKTYPDIDPIPRTQQEIDDYGPNGIDLMKFKDRAPVLGKKIEPVLAHGFNPMHVAKFMEASKRMVDPTVFLQPRRLDE